FQAEDGIRDRNVTGVQTCALPIFELAGQGAAFRVIGKTRVAVFTVVNAYGGIVDRAGKVVRGNRDAQGRRQHAAEIVTATGAYYPPTEPRARNTTLTLVVTDQHLDPLQL